MDRDNFIARPYKRQGEHDAIVAAVPDEAAPRRSLGYFGEVDQTFEVLANGHRFPPPPRAVSARVHFVAEFANP